MSVQHLGIALEVVAREEEINFGPFVTVSLRLDGDHYLHIERNLDPDDPDLEDGWDPLYIERDDQGSATWGNFIGCEVSRTSLTVHLTPKGAKDLELTENSLRVDFTLPDAEFANLRDMTQLLCSGLVEFRVV